MVFKDNFSGHAVDYAQYRPHYPATLFQYLASLVPRRRAWDCATGNGQAAVGLAGFFDTVIATDASEKQIDSAERNSRVMYRVATAEASGLEPESVDLITVGQALHWFDCDAFFAEAKHVLRPEGMLAVWSYNLLHVSPDIDLPINEFYHETLGTFWDAERKLVESGYRTIEFPFDELVPPDFEMQAEWTLPELLGYLRTWSAVKHFMAARGFDPVDELSEDLEAIWGQPKVARSVIWPLSLRVGRR